MIKAFFVSVLMAIAIALVLWSGILDILASNTALYFSLGFLAIVLVAAFIILGNPLNIARDNNEKKD